MTVFNRVFTELFKQKVKKAHLILAGQLVGAISATVLKYFDQSFNISRFVPTILEYFFSMSFFIEFIYLIMTSIQNEKVNRSQTWRLTPLGDNSMYLSNTLSSFISFIYLGLLQIVVSLVLFGFSLYTSFKKVAWHTNITHNNITFDNNQITINYGALSPQQITNILLFLLLLIFAGLAYYITVSFINFSTSAFTDFLPRMSSKIALTLVRMILIIIICYLLGKLWYYAAEFIVQGMFNNSSHLIGSLIIFIIYDIILGGINMFLIDKFVETKQNN